MAILPNVSNILARMYTDRMTVQRYRKAIGSDGEVSESLMPAPELTDIPCRLSLGAKDSPVMTDDDNPSDVQPTLICRPGVPLREGDFITVRRLVDEAAGTWADIYAGNIGRPGIYGSSLQALFRDRS